MTETAEIEQQFDGLREVLAKEDMATFRNIFLEWHMYEEAQFYLSLDEKERQQLYQYLSPHEMANLFDVIEEEHEDIKEFLSEMRPSYAAAMLAEMYTDNAADILIRLDKAMVAQFLSTMKSEKVEDIKELLHYEDKTAGAIMTTDYVAIVANQTVKSAMTLLKKIARTAEIIYYIYVIDEAEKLLGVISLRDLIVSDHEMMISEIMGERVISVRVGDDQENVAKMIRDYDFLAIPVVDYEDFLLGIITVDDIIDVIDDEAASDYSGLAGVDVEAVAETPLKASSKRLPWLITLLF